VKFGAKCRGHEKGRRSKLRFHLALANVMSNSPIRAQLDRARKVLGLKENEALLVFSDGEREFAVAIDVH
jgi:hypothetical protein